MKSYIHRLLMLLVVAFLAQNVVAQPKPAPKKKTPPTAKPAKKPAPINMPVIAFDTKTHDFGKIKTGDKPVFTYNFTNKGDKPLNIDIVSGCDCTELEWTTTTVNPGEKGFIRAVFNTTRAEAEDHKKDLKKYIDIVLKETNPKTGYPLVETLTFTTFIVD